MKICARNRKNRIFTILQTSTKDAYENQTKITRDLKFRTDEWKIKTFRKWHEFLEEKMLKSYFVIKLHFWLYIINIKSWQFWFWEHFFKFHIIWINNNKISILNTSVYSWILNYVQNSREQINIWKMYNTLIVSWRIHHILIY